MPNTEYGVEYEILVQGDGPYPQPDDSVTIAYVGKLPDGRIIDSSDEQGGPYTFLADRGEIIGGIDIMLPDLNEGTRAVLTIPPDLAFGEHGLRGKVPGGATVVYEIEILSVEAAS